VEAPSSQIALDKSWRSYGLRRWIAQPTLESGARTLEEPEKMQEDDVRKVLLGLGSIVDGIGALRTHKGSAHGHEKSYKLKPRHARLTSHAAFTLAVFIIETWEQRG
jgi:hypothetical protein